MKDGTQLGCGCVIGFFYCEFHDPEGKSDDFNATKWAEMEAMAMPDGKDDDWESEEEQD